MLLLNHFLPNLRLKYALDWHFCWNHLSNGRWVIFTKVVNLITEINLLLLFEVVVVVLLQYLVLDLICILDDVI